MWTNSNCSTKRNKYINKDYNKYSKVYTEYNEKNDAYYDYYTKLENFYEDGSYDLKTLNHSYNDMLTDYLLDYKGEPWDEKRPPYKQIDKEHFVNALVEKGFCLYCKETN